MIAEEVEPAVGLQVHGAAAQPEVGQVPQQLLRQPPAVGRERLPLAVERLARDADAGHAGVELLDHLVGTGDGAVRLGEVAPAGKSWMPADAWARGAHPEPGARLGTDTSATTAGEEA